VYGIKFGHVKTFGTSQALIYSALLGGQADVAEVFSTDAQISHDNLVVPTDTRGIFLPDHIAPVVRDDLLRAYPVIRHTLNSLAPLITTPRITALNAQVTFGHKDPMAVARAFLHRHGML
jgi:osmoprotectant transport system substrate-binding protein